MPMDRKGREGTYNFFHDWGQPGAGHRAKGQLLPPCHPAGAAMRLRLNNFPNYIRTSLSLVMYTVQRAIVAETFGTHFYTR